MKCPKCNREILNDSKFCNYCGSTIDVPVGFKICPNCGKYIPVDSEFCQFCGTTIEKTDSDSVKENKPNKGIKHSLPIIIVCCLALIAIIVGLIAIFSRNSSEKTASTATTEIETEISSSSTTTTTAAQVTTTEAPTTTSALIPVGIANGTILKHPKSEKIAPLEIKSEAGTNYYIYMECRGIPEDDMAFYVEGGKTLTVNVPIRDYYIYYATGTAFYGQKHLFGNETQYYKCDEIFDFHWEGEYACGYTITLYKVTGGNLETEEIPSFSFPGKFNN